MVPVHISNPWCRCLFVGMPWCKCPLVGIPWCECFDTNTIYSKIPFIFKIKAFLASKTKIFSNLDLLFPEKPSSSFLLKDPKKLVITDRNLRIGHLLETWWSGSKDLFSQIWLSKEVARFQGLFLEKLILWKSSILKRFIFSSLWIW